MSSIMEVSQIPVTAPAGQPPLPSQQAQLLIRQLKDFYAGFGADSLGQLDRIYTQDVEFRDPVHTMHGCLALKAYFKRMSLNLQHYSIRYLDEHIGAESAWLSWEMDFAHKLLANGRILTVRGMTQLRYTTKVYSHEDCYDLGALVYEHAPVVGPLNRLLKKRMAR